MPAIRDGDDASAFPTDIDAIIEAQPPRMLLTAGYCVAAMMAVLVLAAGVVQVDVVVQGSGQLTTDVPPIVLQPLDRAIVRELKVKIGDAVTKGQVLATLDSTFVQADMASLQAQQRSLTAQLRRIDAEWRGEPFEAKSSDPNDLLQADLHRQRQEQYASRLRAFDEEIRRTQANTRTIDNNRTLLIKQLAIAREVEQMRTTLLQSQSGSRLQYLEAQSVRLRAERDFEDAVNRLTELTHMLETRRAERQGFIDDWRRQILEDLDRHRTDAAKLSEVLAKAERMRDLVIVTAPEDGVVLDVARRSAGSVLREAEPLVTLVPTKGALIAEVMINSGDVGYPKPGDPVLIKVDAFPYQRHGSLEGRLRSVSQESYVPQSGQGDASAPPPRAAGGAFHRARIELTKTGLVRMPDGVRLIPGMTVSAEIKVGTRSVLSYFFNPITRGFEESMREP